MALSILINVDFCYGLEFSHLRPYCHYLPFPCIIISQVNNDDDEPKFYDFFCSFLYEFYVFPCTMNSLTSPSFWTHKMINYYWINMDYWIIYIFFQNFLNSYSSLICCTAVVLELLFSNFPILSPHLTLILFPKSCDFLFIDLIPPPFFYDIQTLLAS